MKSKGKHVLWGNIDLDPKDWQDLFDEAEITNEEDQYNLMWEWNQEYWEDERVALSDIGKKLPYGWSILVIGSLGLWDGVHVGYKFIKNLSDALYSDDDYYELYCDGYHLRARGSHHDGNNGYTFLLFRGKEDDITMGEDKFLYDLVHGNHISKARWHKYTRSIRPYIRDYYGWR